MAIGCASLPIFLRPVRDEEWRRAAMQDVQENVAKMRVTVEERCDVVDGLNLCRSWGGVYLAEVPHSHSSTACPLRY